MLPPINPSPAKRRPRPGILTRLRRWTRVMGPGLITGASDDDPSGIVTYTQAGSQFGLATLWTALITFPLMATMQGMAARIGLVTSQGLTGTLRMHYPKWVLYSMILFCFPATILNIGADIQSMGAVAHLLVPGIPAFTFSILFTGLLLFMIIRYPYQKMAGMLKWLCLALLTYLIVPFLVHPDWKSVLHRTVVPTVHMNKEFLSILVAILGTTISPYLFFWQATMEVEDLEHNGPKGGRPAKAGRPRRNRRPAKQAVAEAAGAHAGAAQGKRAASTSDDSGHPATHPGGQTRRKGVYVDKRILEDMRSDVNVGMLFSNLVTFFIILTAAAVLNSAGIKQIATVEQAASALKPLAGKVSYALFTIGVIGTGFLCIPVLAGSVSYMLAETFQFSMGLDKKFNEARRFYAVIIVSLVAGLCLQFFGVSAVDALIYTAILYGITSPVLIAVILHIGNNKTIMGKYTNSVLSNCLGFLTLILMTAAAAGLLYFTFFT
ncbi:MAG TPA: divalent metal cation transporter [Puia sp.]|nr:divalent metal cation transporter [Puia sp.]